MMRVRIIVLVGTVSVVCAAAFSIRQAGRQLGQLPAALSAAAQTRPSASDRAARERPVVERQGVATTSIASSSAASTAPETHESQRELAAALGVQRWGDEAEEIQAALEGLLGDPDPEIRNEAAAILRSLTNE
jgi:hypothetical protein